MKLSPHFIGSSKSAFVADRPEVDVSQAEIISTTALTVFPSPKGVEMYTLSLKTNVINLWTAKSILVSTPSNGSIRGK